MIRGGFMPILFIIFGFLLGLCFGSFANVLIFRIPKGISVIWPGSACPGCNKKLGAAELFPVLSWIFLRGKCRGCRAEISVRYPLVELLCGLLFAAMACYSLRDGMLTASFVPLAVFAFILLVISFIDADTQEIPDGLVVTGAVAGVFFVAGAFIFPDIFPGARVWYDALLGAVAGAVPLLVIDRLTLLILKKDGFGYGDVKLMAMVGLFLGWQMMLVAFLFAFLSGAVFAAYLMITGKAKRGAYMAFGPFLCIGSLLALWFGVGVLDWYIALLV